MNSQLPIRTHLNSRTNTFPDALRYKRWSSALLFSRRRVHAVLPLLFLLSLGVQARAQTPAYSPPETIALAGNREPGNYRTAEQRSRIVEYLNTSEELRTYSKKGYTSSFSGEFRPIPKDILIELTRDTPEYKFHIARMSVLIDPPQKKYDLILITSAKTGEVKAFVWGLYWMIRPSESFGQLLKGYQPTSRDDAHNRLQSLAKLIAYTADVEVGKATTGHGILKVELLSRKESFGFLELKIHKHLRLGRVSLRAPNGKSIRYFTGEPFSPTPNGSENEGPSLSPGSNSRVERCDFSAYAPVRISLFDSKAVVRRVQPDYPRVAAQRGVQGRVVVKALVNERGIIERACAVDGEEMLRQAAETAALQWKLKPKYGLAFVRPISQRNPKNFGEVYISFNFKPAKANGVGEVSLAEGSEDREAANASLTFEGTVIKLGDRPTFSCGVMAVYRLAVYRVDRVLQGKYEGSDIIVDHLDCTRDVLKDMNVGDKVTVVVSKRNRIMQRWNADGIRKESDQVKTFYIATSVNRGVALYGTKLRNK